MYQDMIQLHAPHFFPNQSMSVHTYEIIHTNWIPYDTCLRNPVGVEIQVEDMAEVGDGGYRNMNLSSSTMKCAMVTTKFHIQTTSFHDKQQHQQQYYKEMDQMEWNLKEMFHRFINTQDFIRALWTCHI